MKHTPIEKYGKIFVKREDLCFTEPAPPFSKCRGIIVHLQKLKDSGITTVGYVETSISMAGWGVVWACELIGLKAVIFDPRYKETPETLIYHRQQWAKFPCTIIPVPAGMAKVNWYIAKKILAEQYGKTSILLPLGLPFKETINATAEEFSTCLDFIRKEKIETVVCCVGSGTIIAGILKGLNKVGWATSLIGVMTRTGNVEQKEAAIYKKAGIVYGGFFSTPTVFSLHDPGWEYTQESKFTAPFPCHKYYDLKAYQWLVEHRSHLYNNILFWNIGH